MPAFSLNKPRSIKDYLNHEGLFLFSCLMIISGLFVSRALVSMGMILMTCNALIQLATYQKIRQMPAAAPYLLCMLYFIINMLSGLWSENMSYFMERLQILLPFLALPFAFSGMRKIESREATALFAFFILLLSIGMSWSLWQYVQQKSLFDEGYGFSKMIPTPFRNDHIRFGLAVVIGIAAAVELCVKGQRIMKVLMGLFIVYGILYLHVLSAKSSLLLFYLSALLLLIRMLLLKRYRRVGMLILFLMAALPVLMFQVSPTFKNKLGYFRYSIETMKNHQRDPNVSDEGRMISYEYALDILRDHPILGVGLGDVYDAMSSYYQRDFGDKQVTALLPHNQFLMAGLAAGIPGIACLILLVSVLMLSCYRKGTLAMSICGMMLFMMMIEPLFETQLGTCMFLFFLLLLLQRRTIPE